MMPHRTTVGLRLRGKSHARQVIAQLYRFTALCVMDAAAKDSSTIVRAVGFRMLEKPLMTEFSGVSVANRAPSPIIQLEPINKPEDANQKILEWLVEEGR